MTLKNIEARLFTKGDGWNFKIGKNVKIKILIQHMAGKIVKKQGRKDFCISCNCFCTLYFLVKMSLWT